MAEPTLFDLRAPLNPIPPEPARPPQLIFCAVYVIHHRESGRVYVGRANDLRARWARHRNRLNAGKHENRHLQAAWRKYGEAAFDFRLLEITDPAAAPSVEQKWLAHFCPYDRSLGFNIHAKVRGWSGYTRGAAPIGTRRAKGKYIQVRVEGHGRDAWRFEHQLVWEATHGLMPKGSVIHHLNDNPTDNRLENLAFCASNGEHIKRFHADQSAAQFRAAARANIGRRHSAESRAKMSAATKGRKKTPEHRAQMAAARRGKKASPEARAKMSANHRRHQTPETIEKIRSFHTGRPKSPEHRARLSAAIKGRKRDPTTGGLLPITQS